MWIERPFDQPLQNNQSWCGWCGRPVSCRRFDKHMVACKLEHIPQSEVVSETVVNNVDRPHWDLGDEHILSAPFSSLDDIPEEYESEEENLTTGTHLSNPTSSDKPPFPDSFIRVIHHPHSGNPSTTIIPIDNHDLEQRQIKSNKIKDHSFQDKPWAPFKTLADFEFTRGMVRQGVNQNFVELLLEGLNGRWCQNSKLSFCSYKDYTHALEMARRTVVQFKESQVSHIFKGKEYTFTFRYRDPWQWILNTVTDPTLCDSIIWYPVKKYLHHHGRITRMYDELNSGDRWWDIQDSIEQDFGIPHCFLPLHLWLDKSNVAKTVTKHPILLRAGFLPSLIRNGSGNGGGVLVGYMPKVGDPNKTTETEDDTLTSVELARFKREVYHKILMVIFRPVRTRSACGSSVLCGDNITRVLYPGFLIHAVDGEEAYCLCGTRGVQANYPCPRCLTHRHSFAQLSMPPEIRYQYSMQAIYFKAVKLSATAAEKLLKDTGLHMVENAFWEIQNSDPYLAYSYDMLHAMDSGEWGKHQWPLLLDTILDPLAGKRKLSANMRQVPRWPSLKHFNDVTSIDFSDGNSYRDILKVVIFCLVDILPARSPVIHCFRTLAVIRAIATLRPVTEEHIAYLIKCLSKYEKYCTKLSEEYGKNYEYPKHHCLIHLPFDLRMKGSTDNYTTRPGEGFQQEVQQAYDQTNKRDTERQMTRTDENQEAIAKIALAIDLYNHAQKAGARKEEENDGGAPPEPVIGGNHWKLGAPLKKISARDWELSQQQNPAFRRFELKLTRFLSEMLSPTEQPSQPLLLMPYQCLHLTYRSLENWQDYQDILRCNPEFHGRPRYDCVVVNTNPNSFARLQALFSVQTTSKNRHDIALIRYFGPSPWKPKTKWDGCQTFEQKDYDFAFIKYFVRGCHMIPAFEKTGKVFYLNDLIDSDAFLRFYLEERLSQTEVF